MQQPDESESAEVQSDPTGEPKSKLEETTSNSGPAESEMQTAVSTFMEMPSMSRVLSVIVLLAGILVVGMLFYKVMVGFFIPLFMAAALVVIFHPMQAWFERKLRGRKSLAAAATTSVILTIVLLPFILLITVAVGQLTGLVGRMDLDDIKSAMDRGREKIGLKLEYADRYRRLESLAGLIGDIENPDAVNSAIEESRELIAFLDQKTSGASPTGEMSDIAFDRLDEFSATVEELRLAESGDVFEPNDKIELTERFHRQGVVASAAIHSWVTAKLGGSFRTQAKLLINPSERDLAEAIHTVREFIQPRFVKFSGATGRAFVHTAFGLLIMVIAIYFFFVDGPGMVRTLMRLSPLDDNYELQLLNEFEKTSRAVVLASVLSALVQGLLAAIAFFFLGFESYVLLFLVTTVMALVPFLGAASVWLPCAIYLGAVDQRYGAAIFLFIYGAALVSSIDNVIKAIVLHGHSELHPLIALLSVLGGVPVFGPIGILIGPMVVVFLQTLLEILNQELELRDHPAEDQPTSQDATTVAAEGVSIE
ncbi:AI-2E family transporter [Roseiconus lacunae]|uniref:AI-2E family transporter n=1 Tax=Roseiconus lacunae TaxID=2605694 RepID=UPI001E2E94A2|nr:AI-2E family transporter [Roseiconus lacunae]MCD0462697.1 AI-2E family transporter [Roseiconus lacunae]